MRRTVIISMILIAFVGCKTHIKPSTDLEENQLHGKVKQMLELTYYYGNVDRVYFEEKTKASDSVLYTFDEKGYYTEAVHLTPPDDNEAEQTPRNIYVTRSADEVKTTAYNSDRDILYQSISKLNPEGLELTRTDVFKKDDEKIVMNYTYDHTNLKTEINIEHKDGNKQKNVLTYNKKGQVIKGAFYSGSKDELFLTSTYTYNSKGYLEKREQKYFTGLIVTTTYEYEYDAQGSAIVVKEYEDGKLTTTKKRIIDYY
jgi:hypothetical protein